MKAKNMYQILLGVFCFVPKKQQIKVNSMAMIKTNTHRNPSKQVQRFLASPSTYSKYRK